jgi:RNA polymerase sigma-70 factor (ECF subfamily)
VRDHAGDLYRFAHRFCGDAAIAEELVQETFYQAWKGRFSLRRRDRARAWLFQILRRRCARWLQERAAQPAATAPVAAMDLAADTQPGPGEMLAQREALQAALDTIEERFKLPLLMVFVEGLTCQQTAECLDLPLGTVLSRIHRARQRLRAALGEKGSRSQEDDDASRPQDPFRPRFRVGGEA